MKEIWKAVKGYEGLYEVSNFGNIASLDYKHMGIRKCLSPGKTTKGYLFVRLFKDKCGKYCAVHRLVAQAFIPNPNGYPQVNHKDEVKTNNNADNLEWCTNNYNYHYGTRIERVRAALSVGVICIETGQYFKSTTDANNSIGSGHVGSCCRGKRKSAGGYHWRYAEEGDKDAYKKKKGRQ